LADGSIILDTRINNKGAYAELKELQAKAKSTAQQVAALDRQINTANSKHLALGKELSDAQSKAESTAAELESVNEQLRSFVQRRAEIEKQRNPLLTPETANLNAQEFVGQHFASDAAKASELQGALDKLQQSIPGLTAKYTEQESALAGLQDQHAALAAQLATEEQAVTRQSSLAQYLNGEDSMQAYFNKQAAGIEKAYAKIEARQNKAYGTMNETATQHAELIVAETQKAVAAQDKAAQAAEQRAVREQAAMAMAASGKSTATAGKSTTMAGKAQIAATAVARTSKAVGQLGRRLAGIVSGALVFNLISSALRSVVNVMGTTIAKTNGVSTALGKLKGAAATAAAGLASALSPAIIGLLNLLTSLINGFLRLLSLLTGKSISSMKQTAKGINAVGSAAGSTSKQADKAKRSLAGFDEIERLDAKTGGSGGANYNFDHIASPLGGITDKLKNFWSTFQTLLAPSVAAWSTAWEQIRNAASAVWPEVQQAALAFWNEGLSPLLTYLSGTFAPGVINAFSEAFAPIVGGVASTAIYVLADLFTWACGIGTDAINGVLIPALDLLLQIWQDLMSGIKTAWDTYGQPLMDGVILAFQNLENLATLLWETIVKPILQNLISVLQQLWSYHLKPLWDDILLLVASVANCLLDLWNNLLAPVAKWIIATFGPAFAEVFNAIADVVGVAVGAIADAIDLAVVVLRGLADFLSAVFRGNWDAAWQAIGNTVSTVWDKMTNAIKTAVNGIIGFINRMISAVVTGINTVINALNGLSFDLPDIFGGGHVGFNISTLTAPQIPYLAQGAVIPANREFLAVLGDQSHGTNVEAPLDTIKQAVAEVMEDLQAGQMAGFEAVVSVLREILSAVYGIELTDEDVGRAVQRWQRKQAIATGGFY
jgi:phage-related protein